ncbi:hypothetical protein IWX90DRAFT_479754 [Phyllosticta citrichinensis]|uniref:Uncharacterized protein n=1 Tax=Phyllosticta citrichinensis TaxID=1130410 RepID=A0ABR1XPJ9_9PEZI
MSTDRDLRADTPFPEDYQVAQTDPGNHEAIGHSGNESNASGEAGPTSSHGPETSTNEEDEDEWDPAMLEQMLEQMIEEDGDDTETETDDRPGWALVLSPPLSTSRHSTPPEVMRWVRWLDINESLREIFNHPCHFIRQVACLKRALWLVDYDVDLDAYQFPYGAEGEMRVERPLPRRYRISTTSRSMSSGNSGVEWRALTTAEGVALSSCLDGISAVRIGNGFYPFGTGYEPGALPLSLSHRYTAARLVPRLRDTSPISSFSLIIIWELDTDASLQEHLESERSATESDDAGPASPKRTAEAISTSEERASGVEESSQQRKKARHS